MVLRRALCPVAAVIVLAGCGTSRHASGAAPHQAAPNRVRELVERHQVFTVRVPKPELSDPHTLVIR